MKFAPRWRPAAVLLALAAAVAAIAVPAPRPAAAQPPAAELKKVPTDAAIFVHVNVAEVWDSKLGDTFRSAKAAELEKGLTEIKNVTGMTPDMVKTVSFFFPKLKGPGDDSTFGVLVAFRKPYDRAALVKGLKELAKKDKAEDKAQVTDKDGVISFAPNDRTKVRVVATDPTRIELYANVDEAKLGGGPADGPLAPAIKAAAEGATVAVGVNFVNLPDEIRGDDVPAEVRPFQPLLRSDAAILTGRLAGDEVKFDLRFRSAEKARVNEAEKSLAAGVTLFQTLQAVGVEQLAKSKKEEEKALLPLLKEAGEVLKRVRVSATESEAVASTTVKIDLPFEKVLQLGFGGATGPAGRAKTQNNLKQIALALHNYHDVYNGFPPASVVDKKGKPMLSWRVMVLPFVEQDQLYKQFKLDEPWDSTHNKAVLDKHPMPPVFALPGVTKDGQKDTHFRVLVNNGALFDPIQATKIQSITDGTSNTIMVITAAAGVPWTKPDEVEFDPKADPRKLLHMKDGGCSVAFADGSVRFLKADINADTLRAMITKAGGEVISDDN